MRIVSAPGETKSTASITLSRVTTRSGNPVSIFQRGSGSQNAIGIGVMGGMISATVLAIFFVPLFFVVVERIFPKRVATTAPETETDR